MLIFCFFLWEAKPSGLQSGPACRVVVLLCWGGWDPLQPGLPSLHRGLGGGCPALCPSSHLPAGSHLPAAAFPAHLLAPPALSFEDLACASFSLKTPAFSGTEVGRETFPGRWPSSVSHRTPLGSSVLAAASPEESWLPVGGGGEGCGVPPIRFPSPLQYGALAVGPHL